MIQLIEVTNPFQPATSRTLHEVDWHEGITAAEVMRAAGIATVRHCCVIDGLAIPEEVLDGYLVADGVTVVSMPSVAGGGWLRMFAEIAVMAAAAVVTGGLAVGPLAALGSGALGSMFAAIGLGNLTAGMVGLIGAGVALGGNMLVNFLMSPGMASDNSSASFDPTGPKTLASGNTPIPKGYGTFRSGGNIIASYVQAEGQDNYINVLLSYGFGRGVSLTDIEINNNPIGHYKGATYQVRLGTNNQGAIPYFNRIVNGYPQNIRFLGPQGSPATPIVVQGTGTATQGLEVVVQFPNGVFYQNSDGSLRTLAITYKVEYSVSGQNNWVDPIRPNPATGHDLVVYRSDGTIYSAPTWVVVPLDTAFSSGMVYAYDNGSHTPGDAWTGTKTVTYTNPDNSTYQQTITLQGEWQPFDINLNQTYVQDFLGGWITMTGASTSAMYQTTTIYGLPPNKYDIRLTKYGAAFKGDPVKPLEPDSSNTGGQTWLHTINEIEYQDLAYPNMILLGVRALASNQLSGSNINVTANVTYAVNAALPAALASYGMDNPAVVAYDMLVDTLYGGGVPASQIDVPAFAAWAAYNDELVSDGAGGQIKRHVFNGVFDQSGTNLWKCLQKVAMMSNASVVQVGRNYTVILDAPVTVPAQVFTSANIVKDSLQDTWLSLDDRANRVEVTFADAARMYRTDEPCAVMLPSDIQAGVAQKPMRVQLLGCTNRAQAWHWAYRKLLSTDKLLLTRKFDAVIEAVACQVGSVIGVQDDVTQWSVGGRIQAGSTTTSLVIDRTDLTFAAGAGWTVSVVHPVLARGTGTISSITGILVTFSANIPAGRIVSIENSSGAVGAVQAIGSNTVTVASAFGFAAGQTVTFYDQDVIDTQPVSALSGTTLTPAAAFLQTPTEDCPWVYGQSSGSFPAKLFTVTGIKRKGDFHFTVETIEYDASVYADDTPQITQTLGVPDADAAVTTLTATESYALAAGANGGQASTVAVGWVNGPNTVATQIWVARNEANQPLSGEVLVQTVSKGTTCSLTYPTGSILQIRAVGVDGRGIPAPYSTAPTVTITVQGVGLAPGDVTGFAGNFQVSQTVFNWNAVSGVSGYEIRYNADATNPNWQAATLLWSGTGTTWADTTIRGGLYLIKALSATDVESVSAASFAMKQSSSYLNSLGLAPSQSIAIDSVTSTYDSTSGMCSATISWSSQPLYRGDGTSVTLAAGSIVWTTVLAAATTYYVYTRLRLSDMTLHSAKGDPPTLPDTSPNPVTALQAASDGYYQGPSFSFTTASSSTSGGTTSVSDPGVCPDSRELVVTLERGTVAVGTVAVGEHVQGRTLAGELRWRRVKHVRQGAATTWYRVDGYLISPVHPVWKDGAWRMPYTLGTLEIAPGTRVSLQLDEADYDEQAYLLVGRGEPLLMHNQLVGYQPGC